MPATTTVPVPTATRLTSLPNTTMVYVPPTARNLKPSGPPDHTVAVSLIDDALFVTPGPFTSAGGLFVPPSMMILPWPVTWPITEPVIVSRTTGALSGPESGACPFWTTSVPSPTAVVAATAAAGTARAEKAREITARRRIREQSIALGRDVAFRGP